MRYGNREELIISGYNWPGLNQCLQIQTFSSKSITQVLIIEFRLPLNLFPSTVSFNLICPISVISENNLKQLKQFKAIKTIKSFKTFKTIKTIKAIKSFKTLYVLIMSRTSFRVNPHSIVQLNG